MLFPNDISLHALWKLTSRDEVSVSACLSSPFNLCFFCIGVKRSWYVVDLCNRISNLLFSWRNHSYEFSFVAYFSGRIHAAVVSNINIHTRSVTVEWSEKGETKGKEVTAFKSFFFRILHVNGIIYLNLLNASGFAWNYAISALVLHHQFRLLVLTHFYLPILQTIDMLSMQPLLLSHSSMLVNWSNNELSCFEFVAFIKVFSFKRSQTHTRLTVLFPGLPGWAGTRKVKPIWTGFYWSKRQWVAVASAGPYASLHIAPDR